MKIKCAYKNADGVGRPHCTKAHCTKGYHCAGQKAASTDPICDYHYSIRTQNVKG